MEEGMAKADRKVAEKPAKVEDADKVKS